MTESSPIPPDELADLLLRFENGEELPAEIELEVLRAALEDVETVARVLDAQPQHAADGDLGAEAAMARGLERGLQQLRASHKPARAAWRPWGLAAAALVAVGLGLWKLQPEAPHEPLTDPVVLGAGSIHCVHPQGPGLLEYGAFRIEAELRPLWTWELTIHETGVRAPGAPPREPLVISGLEELTWNWNDSYAPLPAALRWTAVLRDASGSLQGSASAEAALQLP